MKVLKEDKTFNPFTDKKWLDVLTDSEVLESIEEDTESALDIDNELDEAVANPFKIKGPEVNQTGRGLYGTCFKRTGHPSIYGITGMDPENGRVEFLALDHEHGNVWTTDIDTLTAYFNDGTFHVATDEDIKKAYEYED